MNREEPRGMRVGAFVDPDDACVAKCAFCAVPVMNFPSLEEFGVSRAFPRGVSDAHLYFGRQDFVPLAAVDKV